MFPNHTSQARGTASGAFSNLTSRAQGSKLIVSSIFYALGSILVFGLLGLAAVRSPFSYPLTEGLLQLAFLLVGWAYTAWLPRWLGWLEPGRRWQRAWVLAVTAVFGAAAIWALQWLPWAKNHLPAAGFTTTVIPFLLPFFFRESYWAWLEVPYRQYKIWQYNPLATSPNLARIDLNNFMVVHFWMSRRFGDALYHDFTSKAPYEMRLGDLFAIFLTDYNRLKPDQTLQYFDNQGKSFGWLFYAKRPWWRQRQYFDPDHTFQDNFLRQGSIIVAERVPMTLTPVDA